MKKVYDNMVIDGNSLLHRCVWAALNKGSNVTNFEIRIFLASLKRIIKEFLPEKIYVAWDVPLDKGAKNFRKEIYDKYKDGRNVEMQKKVRETQETASEFIDILGGYNIYPKTLEADDAIAFLIDNLIGTSLIVSSDQDLYQLVRENVDYFNLGTDRLITIENFETVTHVPLKYFLLYKCVLGDTSDNVPGVYGIGPKKFNSLYLSGRKTFDEFQVMVIERNMRLFDLSQGYPEIPGEKEALLAQFKTDKRLIDHDKYVELCDALGLDEQRKWAYDLGSLLASRHKQKSLLELFNSLKKD